MFKILAVMMVIQCATSMKRPFRSMKRSLRRRLGDSGDEERKVDEPKNGEVVPLNDNQEVYEYILNVAFGRIDKNLAALMMSFTLSKSEILASDVMELWSHLGMFKDPPTHIRFQYTDHAFELQELIFPLCRNPSVGKTTTTKNLWSYDTDHKAEFHCSLLNNGEARFSVVNKKYGYNDVLTCKIPSLRCDAVNNIMKMIRAPQIGGALPVVPDNAINTAKFDYVVLNNGEPVKERWDGKKMPWGCMLRCIPKLSVTKMLKVDY